MYTLLFFNHYFEAVTLGMKKIYSLQKQIHHHRVFALRLPEESYFRKETVWQTKIDYEILKNYIYNMYKREDFGQY